MRRVRHPLSAIVMVCILCSVLLAGCVTQPSDSDGSVQAGVNPDPEKGPSEIITPVDPDLSTPESAVQSYLDWITFSYRMANSELSTMTMTPMEGVRVDSYIELNRQQNQALDQTLELLEMETVSVEETVAVVVAREDWSWRYFTLDTITWSGDVQSDSFDTTYTVLLQPDGLWLVNDVEASLVDRTEADPADE